MSSGLLFPRADPNGKLPGYYPHQRRGHNMLAAAIRAGEKRILISSPTGSGKTRLAFGIIENGLRREKRATFIVHRNTLVHQTSSRADEWGLDHGIIQSNHPRRDDSLLFQIATIQTLATRGSFPVTDVAIQDEAHLQFVALTRWAEEHPTIPLIGLTATPCTEGLGLIYKHLIQVATMRELTDAGELVPMRPRECREPDMDEKGGEEWTKEYAAQQELHIVGDVPSEYLAHGEGLKAIYFGPTGEYCRRLRNRFDERGVRAEVFLEDTKPDQRKTILDEFTGPDCPIRVLISVDALAEGFDVPDVGVIGLCRPLRKSFSKLQQMLGRGARKYPGKKYFIVLDHTGNLRRFAADLEETYNHGYTSLDTAEKLDTTTRRVVDKQKEGRGCPACGYKPFHQHCMACNYEKPQGTREVPGEMSDVVSVELLAQQDIVITKGYATSRQQLWQQLCYVARNSGKPLGRARALYKGMTGNWPPTNWQVFGTAMLPPSPATAGKIKQLDIAYRARLAKEAKAVQLKSQTRTPQEAIIDSDCPF